MEQSELYSTKKMSQNISFRDDKVISKLKEWANENESVRTMILTGSRVDPHACIDKLSDYDVELYVNDFEPYLRDDWLHFFDDIMLCWPLKPTLVFDSRSITRLILFENGIRIDFQIGSQKLFNPSQGYDNGFVVLADKDRVTEEIEEPTFSEYMVKRPTENEYRVLVNDFFWDATYVAKNLWRDELFYAKYMLDGQIRFEYFQTMIEWYIASQNGWDVATGKHGRWFRRYLEPKVWREVEKTFAGANPANNWYSFFKMMDLFSMFAQAVAEDLMYKYPRQIDLKSRAYCRSLSNSAENSIR